MDGIAQADSIIGECNQFGPIDQVPMVGQQMLACLDMTGRVGPVSLPKRQLNASNGISLLKDSRDDTDLRL